MAILRMEPTVPQAENIIRILLVDDQDLFRGAIATLIDGQPDMTVIGQANNGLSAVEQAHALDPDLIVMDVEMPVMNGVEATRLIREQLPHIKIVMLTVSEADDFLFDAIRFGAHGYLLKDLRPDQLFDLLRSVMRNQTPLAPAVASRLLDGMRSGLPSARGVGTPAEGEPVITRRELEILQLVAEGLSNKQIGAKLWITEGTVKSHMHNALDKLGLENRAQAASYVVRHGLARRPHRDPGEAPGGTQGRGPRN